MYNYNMILFDFIFIESEGTVDPLFYTPNIELLIVRRF